MIEIRQAKPATQSLDRQGVRDDMPDAQAGDANGQRAEPGLFRNGDVVPVAIKS